MNNKKTKEKKEAFQAILDLIYYSIENLEADGQKSFEYPELVLGLRLAREIKIPREKCEELINKLENLLKEFDINLIEDLITFDLFEDLKENLD